MKVAFDSLSPSFGPSWAPTTRSKSQGMVFSSTNSGLEEDAIATAQTALVSRECCHVARGVPLSNGSLGLGLGLRKWVMTWSSSSSNKVACGPKNAQAKPEAGHIAAGVITFGHGRQM